MTKIRPISLKDIPALSAMHNGIFKEWNPRPLKLERDFAPTYDLSNLAGCFGAYDKGRIVGHAASRRLTVNIEGTLLPWSAYGNVMTDDKYRGQGIGTRLNTLIWKKMEREGVDGIYISGGRGLYTRMGATKCGDYRNYSASLKQLQPAVRVGKVRVRLSVPGDVQTLIRLHAQDKTGFLRLPIEFRTVVEERYALLMPGKAWIIESKGQVLAYAIAGPSYGVPANPKNPKGTLTDYAGSRAALLAGLPLIMKKAGLTSLEISTGGWDGELNWMLEQLGLKGKYGSVHGTHMVLNPARMMRRLKPYFAASLGADAAERLKFKPGAKNSMKVSLGSQSLDLPDIFAFSRLVFGDKPQTWDKSVPIGPLGSAIRGIFPLPFPVVGLSWM